MIQHRNQSSHVRDVGPPAIRLLTVNINREEDRTECVDVDTDDAMDLNPQGRLIADTSTLKTRKETLNISTWNVRTLLESGKFDNLIKEFDDMNLDILGVSETHWNGSGIIQREHHTMIFSGGEENRRGVGIVVNNRIKRCVMGYWPISERLIMCKIQAKPFNFVVMQGYAPTADQPEENIEAFYEEIEMALKQTKSDDIVFLLGDFNAKVGSTATSKSVGKYGLGKMNERGEMLIHFCEKHNMSIMNTMFKHPPRRLYTWKSPGDITRNQIDFIITKTRFKNNVKKCRTYPGADINSDHNPVVAKVQIKLKIPAKAKRSPNLDFTALRQPEIREEFAVKVQNRFSALMEEYLDIDERDTSEQIDKRWANLHSAINDTQNEVLPRKVREARKDWMNDEILEMMKERKRKKGTDEYVQIHKQIKLKCKEAKEGWANNKCKYIEEMSDKHQVKQMFNEISQMTQKKKIASGCIKSKDGEVLFETDKILKRWTEYVEELFYDDRPENPIIDFLQGPDIIKAEVESALKQMSSGKAKGVDNIPTESLRALNDTGVLTLTRLCNDMYKTAYIPEDLRTSVFIVLPKKANAIECSDHRTISLMCHILKLLLTIILKRISIKIDSNVGREQAGFRRNSGTREGVFNLRILVERYLEMSKNVYACFIDYSKAFDTVKHTELIKCLQTTDIDENDIAVISNLYWQQKTKIRIDNDTSDSLNISRGVRQGCVLSPALFNLYTDVIFRNVENFPGLKIGGVTINNLRYADDTVLLAESEKDLQRIVDVVKDKSERFGLLMNAKKTKTMVFSKHDNVPSITIKINNNLVDQVKSFQYLGVLVTEDGRSEKELVRRIALAKKKFSEMSRLLTNHDLSLKTKIRLTKCYIWSVLLYASETWSLTSTMETRLRSFEMWTYRRLSRTSWKEKKTNQEVLKKLGIKRTTLISTVQKRRATYYGHVRRHQCIQKQIMEGKVDGKRGRGRRRTSWLSNVATTIKQPINTCATMAMERQLWRKVTSNVEDDKELR